MGDEHWHDPLDHGIGVFLSGEGLVDVDGLPISDDSFFLAINPSDEKRGFTVPNGARAAAWQLSIDTAAEPPFPVRGRRVRAGSTIDVARESIVRAPGTRRMTTPERSVPRATYRLQLRPSFGFGAAGAVVPYLERLGVSHVYTSPILQATPGSEHGYDVVDPHRVNEELGGDAGHVELSRLLGRHHLGQILDIVPNHMAIYGRREPVVVGRARERSGQPLRALLRRGLGSARGPSAERRPAPDPG